MAVRNSLLLCGVAPCSVQVVLHDAAGVVKLPRLDLTRPQALCVRSSSVATVPMYLALSLGNLQTWDATPTGSLSMCGKHKPRVMSMTVKGQSVVISAVVGVFVGGLSLLLSQD